MKYRKKPVVIEAEKFLGPPSWDKILVAFGDPITIDLDGTPFTAPGIADVAHYDRDENEIVILTLEGMHRAISGDWIIRGVFGEFYPCKDDIFRMTYEPVDSGEPANDHH